MLIICDAFIYFSRLISASGQKRFFVFMCCVYVISVSGKVIFSRACLQ